jgi:hypothetical protein
MKISVEYNETKVMQFSFTLLRIRDLYMFRTLLAHPQEAVYKRHLVYGVRISVDCGTVAVSLPPEDEQVMLKKCRGLCFSIN